MKYLPWLCGVLLAAAASSTRAGDPAHTYDAGEEIYDGRALDTLAMACHTRIDVETLCYLSKNRPRLFSRDPLQTVQRLEVLATLAESHNAPPDLAAALQTVMPRARVITNAAGGLLLKDKNSQMPLYSPMESRVVVHGYTGKLSALLESLKTQGVRAHLALGFSLPNFRKLWPLDFQVTIQDFDGSFRELLVSIISKRGKNTRYHTRTTVHIDTEEVDTEITVSGELEAAGSRIRTMEWRDIGAYVRGL